MEPIKMRLARGWTVLLLLLAGCSFQLNPQSLQTRTIKLPLPAEQISFDDISYDAKLGRLIVPAAETGQLALIEPSTMRVAFISGFSTQETASTSTSAVKVVGATSAVSVRGMIYALDRTAKKIGVIDPGAGKIITSVPVQDTPDYIRFVAATNELWVTEKVRQQIEVFSLEDGNPPVLKSIDTIDVPNGPEGLLIDRKHGLAYTNEPQTGTTAVIQVMTHSIADHWGNGCSKARGMAIDDDRGFLFVVCNEGKLVVMDTNDNGFQVTSANYGGSLDFIAYNPTLKHIYVPSGASGILAVFALQERAATVATATPTPAGADTGLSATPVGKFTLVRLGTADTALKARCVTVDDHNNIWVCDPQHGQLFLIPDTFPAGS